MKNKIIKYGIWLVVVVCFFVGISVAVYQFNKPKRDISKIKPEYSITAAQLLTEFTKNEQAANSKYLSPASGKVIKVSGIIGEIDQKGDSTLNILLKIPSNPGCINCSMGKSEIPETSSLKVGDKVVIKGECAGYIDITNEISMVKCIQER